MWQNGETMNVYHIGAMEEVPIRHLAELVADAVGQPMELVPGEAAVGGTPRRCPDIAKMRGIGYEPKIGLAEGVARTTRWYLDNPRPTGGNALQIGRAHAELQSLMRNSYAVFCLKKTKDT